MFEFEWDENKSLSNKKKHGIDFQEATALFEKGIKIYFAKEVNNEKRYLISNFLDGKCYSAIFTIRSGKIRIISVRRCRKEEKQRISND